jgi:hypothetical protein
VKSLRLRAASLPILAFVLVAGLANAEPSAAQKAMASQFFDDAEKLMASGKTADGCAKYAESQRLDPQLGTLLHLADCYEKVGKTASAWATFKDAVEIAAQRKDGREPKARAKVADLEARLPKLVVTLTGRAPAGIEVRQDGEIVGRAAWGSPVPVDPGRHRITAKAPGCEQWFTSVDVPPGASSTRVAVPELLPESAPVAAQPVPVAPAPAAPPLAPPPYAPPPTAPSPPPAIGPQPAELSASGGGSTQQTIGYVVGGVGVVGLGMGAVFGLTMKSKLSDRDAVCGPNYLCTSTDQVDQITQLTNDARGAATVSGVSFAIGGAALVTGVVLLLTAPSNEPKKTGAIDVRPWVGPSSAGAAVGGLW